MIALKSLDGSNHYRKNGYHSAATIEQKITTMPLDLFSIRQQACRIPIL